MRDSLSRTHPKTQHMGKDSKIRFFWTPAAIVGIYLVFGFAWIYGSDWALTLLVPDDRIAHQIQTYKGIFYVLLTGVVLYLLIRKGVSLAREIEADRLRSLDRYDKLVENANDGIFTLDTDGRFSAANRAVEKITGYSREEILKLRFEDILAPENRDYVRLLLDPQNTQNPAAVSELRIIRKDAGIAYIEVSSRPLSTLDSRTSIENIARDVTQRHIMQAELEDAKVRYQRLIETANEGIWTVDFDNVITLVNRKFCELTGFDSSSLIG